MPLILEPGLTPFKELLRRTCGFSFAGDRERTLQDGLAQRMALRGAGAPSDYLALLLGDPGELDRLVELLTVNETYFLREPEHLNLLVGHLVPERLAEHPDPVRILCAGCSTGEEPYSVAMLLQDRAGPACARLAITGVDIDASAIAKARAATYGRYSFRGMDPGFEARHFEAAGPLEQRVKGPVRERVEFAVLNLLSPGYPPGLENQDIILYRNVSIYFPKEVQQDVFQRLAALLKPGGYLLVGATETLYHDVGILPLVERNALYVFRKTGGVEIQDRRRTRRTPPLQAPAPGPAARSQVVARIPGGGAGKDTAAVRAHPAAGADPDRLRRLFDDALECARTRREGEALAILGTLLEGNPGHVRAHTLKASVLLALSRPGDARPACEAALALDPFCLEACLMLGMIARQKGDDLEALKRFREAIYLDATFWFAHYGLAEILAAKGERARARTGFETVLRLLGSSGPGPSTQRLFPLKFNAGEFVTLCRHKLARLQES